MTVTAEGVENRTALEALAALGCDHAQGLVIGPWILAPALTRRVRREARRFTTQT
jgi:EAL domain-containing protein (putative c-di-GMP-specific phosphodiesterase class I)